MPVISGGLAKTDKKLSLLSAFVLTRDINEVMQLGSILESLCSVSQQDEEDKSKSKVIRIIYLHDVLWVACFMNVCFLSWLH